MEGRYKEAPRNVVVEDDRHLSLLKAWADAVHGEKEAGNGNSALLVAQVSHPGRQCPLSVTWRPVAPSAVQVAIPGTPKLFNTPRELREEEIEEIVARFATTASVLHKAGFDGVQVRPLCGLPHSQPPDYPFMLVYKYYCNVFSFAHRYQSDMLSAAAFRARLLD